MRKSSSLLLLLLLVAFIVLLTSCGVKIPKEMPDSVTIEYKNHVQLPLAATTVAVKDYIMDAFSSITEDLPLEATISEWYPMTLEVSTGLEFSIGNYLETLSLDFSGADQTIDLQVSGVNLEGPAVSFQIPSISDPDPLSLTVTTGQTSETLDFSGFTIVNFSSGHLVVKIEYSGAEVDTMLVEVEGLGSASFSNLNDGDVVSETVDLSGKSLENGAVVTLTATMASISSPGGSATLTFSFADEVVASIEGISLDLSQAIDLPSSVENLSIASGNARLHFDGLELLSVSGSLEYPGGSKALSTDAGDLLVDLSGVTLPATLHLDGADVSVIAQEVIGNTVEGSLSFEDVVLERVRLQAADLDVSTSVSVDLSGIEGVKRVELSGGVLSLQYNNTLPATINLRIKSDELGLDELLVLLPSTESEEEVDLSGLVLDLESYDSFTISIDASPEGYDGMYLELENVELGSDFAFSATSSIRDLGIESVVIGEQNVDLPLVTDMNLYELLGSATQILNSINIDTLPMEAYLGIETSVPEMIATYTLSASWTGFSTDITISSDATFADISGFLKRLLKDLPRDFSLSVTGSIGEATITSESSMAFLLGLKVPLDFDLEDDVELIATEIAIPIELSDVATMLEVLDSATLTVQIDNTTGINISGTVASASETLFSGTIGETATIPIQINAARIENMLESGVISLELVLPAGHYTINGEGEISLVSWLDLMLDLVTTVELKGGEE
ncbi:MAG: hypothetical protein PWP37_159 [Thermotogota bacterium]|nr:hypothetical protein [Thermotogota bacterium]MDK2863967.1 hypothetical protein [Thermotogota bacterium]